MAARRRAFFRGNPHRDPDPPDTTRDPGGRDPGTNIGGPGYRGAGHGGTSYGGAPGGDGASSPIRPTRPSYSPPTMPERHPQVTQKLMTQQEIRESLLAKQEFFGGLLGFALGLTMTPAASAVVKFGMKKSREKREKAVDERMRNDPQGAYRSATSLAGGGSTQPGPGGDGPQTTTTKDPGKEKEKPDDSPFPFTPPTTPTDYTVAPPKVQAGIPNFLAQAQADIRRARTGLRR